MKLSSWLSRTWVKGLLGMVASAAFTLALAEFLFPTRVPRALQGKWVVVEGDLKGDTLEVFADGTMIAKKHGVRDKPAIRRPLTGEQSRDPGPDPTILRGTIRLVNNTLRISVVNPLTGNDVTSSQTILDWTEFRLVVEDEQDELLIMGRQM